MLTIKLDISKKCGYNYLIKIRKLIMKHSSVETLVRKVNGSEKIRTVLRIFTYLVSALSVAVFLLMLLHFMRASIFELLKYLIVLGFPFLLVGVLRRVIKAPRPYELYDFIEHPSRRGTGNSFPSKHAFSVFAIGTLCLFVFPILGAVTLVFGALLCFCRVAEGIHFVRDVLAGAIIGVISSLIGALILV